MILSLRENLRYRRWLRPGIVAGLVLALLAFPCGPLAASLGPQTGHALAAVKGPVDSKHGDAECAHGAKKHESSCCNECSSWLTARFDDGTAVIINAPSSHRDLPAVALTYIPVSYAKPDRDPRLTGPPPTASLDGTSIYSRTQRYRI